jgi:4-methyl-5(b-hydroxyethyl)-thiazole monophosphate biosynthesis
MSKQILFAISTGTETMEFSAPLDILCRAGGQITVAKVKDPTNPSDTSLIVTTAQGVKVQADVLIEDVLEKEYDMIVCPGGLPNAEYLGKCNGLIEMLKKQKQSGKYYAAICASPAMVFEPHGLLEGEAGTCYPSMQGELKNQEKVKQRVVVSNKCITSQGPCTALEFGYALCEELFNKEKAEQLKKGMVFY